MTQPITQTPITGHSDTHLMRNHGNNLAELKSTQRITSTVFEVTLRPFTPLRFQPGQYIQLHIPLDSSYQDVETKFFSIASAPRDREVRLCIKNKDQSLKEKLLQKIQSSETLGFSGPFGKSLFRFLTHRNVLVLANGTGMAPFHSLIQELGPEFNINVIWGTKNEKDFFYYHELERHPAVNVFPCVTLPTHQNHGCFEGRVTEFYMKHRDHFPQQSCDVFLCGHPNMMQEMKDLLIHSGVHSNRIHDTLF